VPTILSRLIGSGSSLVMIAVVLALAPARVAAAQSGFSVAHNVVATTPTHVEVTGTVVNETRAEALDVGVTVEALNASGKVVSRGISYVAARLPGGSSANFVAKVPVVPGTTSYRARVTSFRFMQSIQGP
jgi:hypothetical protein